MTTYNIKQNLGAISEKLFHASMGILVVQAKVYVCVCPSQKMCISPPPLLGDLDTETLGNV